MSSVDKDRTVKFIAKLLELTQTDRIKWEIAGDQQYKSIISGRNIRLKKEIREVKDPNVLTSRVMFGNSKGPVPKIRRLKFTVLELLSDDGIVVFKFDTISGLSDLFDSVSYAASGVSALIDDVLAN